jgi:hypothetical protein
VVSDVSCPNPRFKVYSLVRSRGPFLGADLPLGGAPRAGLVQDAACGTGAQRRLVLDETEHGAMLVQVGPPASSKTAIAARSVSGASPMANKDRVATIN